MLKSPDGRRPTQSLRALRGDFMQERYGVRSFNALQKKLIKECHPHVRSDKRKMRRGPYAFDQQKIDAQDKANARAKVATALKAGKIQKKPCFICGNEIVDAHHVDYSRPLDVIWLCPPHHAAEHRRLRAKGR